MQYMTEIRDTKDGKASYGAAFLVDANGKRWFVGHTKNYAEYPRMVRARAAAENLCRQHARKHFPLHTFTAIKA